MIDWVGYPKFGLEKLSNIMAKNWGEMKKILVSIQSISQLDFDWVPENPIFGYPIHITKNIHTKHFCTTICYRTRDKGSCSNAYLCRQKEK